MNKSELIEVHKQAASALAAGAAMANNLKARRMGLPRGELPAYPQGAELGGLLATPGAFWASAQAGVMMGDGDTVRAIGLETKLASAKLAGGDYGFVRETLLGQAGWLGVVAYRTMARAETFPEGSDKAMAMVKLALQAQRQAMMAVASAAALNKLEGVAVDFTG